jgi:TPR repeat protein
MIVFGEYRTSISSLEKLDELVKSKSVNAMFDLSIRHLNGDLAEKNFHYAISMLSELANNNDAVAQRVLGDIYLEADSLGKDDRDISLSKNKELGLSLLRNAADNGDEIAQSQLILLSKNDEILDAYKLKVYQKNVIQYAMSHKHRNGIVIGLVLSVILVFVVIYALYYLIF